jgi:hypothetical protein
MRDEGYRYDPVLAHHCYALTFEVFHRQLALLSGPSAESAAETRH